MWHFVGWVVVDISKNCDAFCLQGQAVPRLICLLDREDKRRCLPSDIALTCQKTWLFKHITVRTSDLGFPFVHCLVQVAVTVCVPCTWWCMQRNGGNKLQGARPLLDQAYLNVQAMIFILLFPTGCSVCAPVGACEKVDLLREARSYRVSTLFNDCRLPLLLG